MLTGVLSILVSLGYLIYGATISGAGFTVVLAYLIIPLSLIWFGGAFGGITNVSIKVHFRWMTITNSSPGWILELMGWALLLLPLAVAIYFYPFSITAI